MKSKNALEYAECVVCYEVHPIIYECTQCRNLLCSGCAVRLDKCPMCRLSFQTRPYVRSRIMEENVRLYEILTYVVFGTIPARFGNHED